MSDRIALIHAVSSDLGSDREMVERRIEQRAERQREREAYEQKAAAHDAARAAWRAMSWEAREALLLEVLGDERLTARELALRLSEKLGGANGSRWHRAVDAENLRTVAMRLLASGQLDRVAEGVHRGHTGIWQWHRKRLDGPIAELERAYRDDDEAVA